MELLLDTHALLWFYSGDSALSDKAQRLIRGSGTRCYLSVASLWEITIKLGLGKLKLDSGIADLFHFIERNHIEVLQIEFEHLIQLQQLPDIHRDPFDRLIISQARAENLPVVSKDLFFSSYDVVTVWE
jgi:PIN domain nuclease of toxin-antitoxin system